MMYLTDYYKFERVATIAKMRLDCTASTQSYPAFEEKRATKPRRPSDKVDGITEGSLIIYFGDVHENINAAINRKAAKCLSIKQHNLSSVFVPEVGGRFAYGDVNGTADELLFVFTDFSTVNGVVQPGGVLEVFVARGLSRDKNGLFNLLCDGVLDEEMAVLREQAARHTEPKK